MKTFITLNCGRKRELSPKYPTCPNQTREPTIIMYHKWKTTINSFLLDNKSEVQKKAPLIPYNFKAIATIIIRKKLQYNFFFNALLSLFDFTGDWNHCQMRRCCSSMGGLFTSPCSRTVASMEKWAGLHVCDGVYFSFKLRFWMRAIFLHVCPNLIALLSSRDYILD